MKKYSISEILKNSRVLSDQNLMPFQITYQGKVVGEVVMPGMKWPECEGCGEVTKNVAQFKTGDEWETLVLCDKCRLKLL